MGWRVNRWASIAGIVGPLWAVPAGGAQDVSTYYTVRHPDQFSIDWKAFYAEADARTAETRAALPHTLDIAYGEHPKQRLDVYRPAASSGAGRVFVFLHGGGFREGDRAHYGYVARPLAAAGVVTVVASYRLTPEFTYPAQVDDSQRLLRWTYEHIAEYGGDPGRIFIGGHSAGAILAAFVGLRTDWLSGTGLPRDLVKGCVPVSGAYDLRNERSLENYVPDPDRRAEASPLLHVDAPPAHTIVGVGSAERDVASSRLLVEQIRGAGGSAALLVLDGLPHDDTARAFGNPKSPLVVAMLEMIAGR